jgi:hypothetical protein
MSYILLRGRWCDITVLDIRALTKDKIDDVKDSLYNKLESVFDNFPKYHMNILLGDFSAKVGREDIFKPTTGNESLHEISNDNGARIVHFAISRNVSKVQSSHIVTFINLLGHIIMERIAIKLTILC